jgi:hypothetical protein
MTTPPTAPPAEALAAHERVAELIARQRQNAKVLARCVRALQPLARPALYQQPKRQQAAYDKARRALEALTPQPRSALATLAELEQALRRAREDARAALGPALAEACGARGLALRVVSREAPLQVRIAPLAVTIDFDAGLATLAFARQPLATAPLTAGAILKAYDGAVAALQTPFDAATTFEAYHRAYRMARAAGHAERVELRDFLPFLALAMQPAAFKRAPSRKHFRDYGRAQLAWDVLRLRRAGALQRDGLRLNFGVATGTTASQRDRALYLEDEDGNGEYKLTVFVSQGEDGR